MGGDQIGRYILGGTWIAVGVYLSIMLWVEARQYRRLRRDVERQVRERQEQTEAEIAEGEKKRP